MRCLSSSLSLYLHHHTKLGPMLGPSFGCPNIPGTYQGIVEPLAGAQDNVEGCESVDLGGGQRCVCACACVCVRMRVQKVSIIVHQPVYLAWSPGFPLDSLPSSCLNYHPSPTPSPPPLLSLLLPNSSPLLPPSPPPPPPHLQLHNVDLPNVAISRNQFVSADLLGTRGV